MKLKKIKSILRDNEIFYRIVSFYRTLRYDSKIKLEDRSYAKVAKKLNLKYDEKKLLSAVQKRTNAKISDIKSKQIKIFAAYCDELWMPDAYTVALKKLGIYDFFNIVHYLSI